MDFVTVAAAIVVLTLVVVYYYVVSRTTTNTSPWPKGKQSHAYIRKVIPNFKDVRGGLHSLDYLTPAGGITTIHDVTGFVSRHGNEFTAYCIDWEQEAIVLIRLLDGVDLKRHPFLRDAMRQNAAEVLCIPLAQLQAVADTIADDVAHVEEVFVYISARCGSTLLTRLVEATSVAQAASEPDVLSDISVAVQRLRSQTGQTSAASSSLSAALSTEEDIVVLLRNVVILLNYNLVTSDPRHRSVIFYKFSNEVLLVADLLSRVFPAAKAVFMYRNGLEVLESFQRLTFRHKYIPYVVTRLAVRLGFFRYGSLLPDYMRCLGDDPKFSTLRYRGTLMFYYATYWAGAMQCAAELQKKRRGHFFNAILNYTAIANDKEKTFRLLMRKLGVNWSPGGPEEDRKKMEKALVEDSQAGSNASARTNTLGEMWAKDESSPWCGHWEREYLREACRYAGNDISGPDFVFPGSIL